MLNLNNGDKTIEITFDPKVHIQTDEFKKAHYTINAPIISCSSYADAELIKQYINEAVYKFANDILYRKG